jgi:hypothetical protein
VNLSTVVDEVLDGMVASRLLSKEDLDDVVDTHLITRDYTYPIPSIERDDALAVIQPWLEKRGIYSRGRFGSWKYEIGNMDHAVQMGAECAEHLVNGAPELCVNDVIPKKEEQTLRLLPPRWRRRKDLAGRAIAKAANSNAAKAAKEGRGAKEANEEVLSAAGR